MILIEMVYINKTHIHASNTYRKITLESLFLEANPLFYPTPPFHRKKMILPPFF